jgi:cystathionine gamma-synthase
VSRSGRLDRSTAWAYVDGQPDAFFYSRDGHPTGVDAEQVLGELDGGHALLFASGAAAAATTVLSLLGPGKTVAIAKDAYYGTVALLRGLDRWGLRCVEFDQTRRPPPEADLVWLEAPSNPFLTFPDLEAAVAHPAPVVVDATAATPILLRPLEHGADLVLHSATKYLGGHDDVLLGALGCRLAETAERLAKLRSQLGAVAAPDVAWLLLRSLKTLDLRVRRQSQTALELARRLDAHPLVERVRYPGLGPDPQAARWMSGGFGELLSFDVRGDAAAVERATRLIANRTSLGGVESSLETRRRWEGERVPENLIRLSVGLEDPEELWADLEQALATAGR